MDKKEASKVLVVETPTDTIEIYASSSPDGLQFALFIKAQRSMTAEDVLLALDTYTQGAWESGTDILGDQSACSSEH